MKTRQLGRTGPELSILGFGAASIGNLYTPIDEDTAHAAWHGGVRYYDTAPTTASGCPSAA